MALYGAIAEAPKVRGGSRKGAALYFNTGALSSGSVAFATPFKTVLAVTATINKTTTPGDSTSVLTYGINGNDVTIYGWKNTGGTDPTLVATDGTDTVSVIVVGVF